MTDHQPKLDALRKKLDDLDAKLVELINGRAELARQIGEVKAEAGLRVYAPDRERTVLDRVCELSGGPVTGEALRSVYRELMSASLALERTPRIAILGPPGSFSHLAGRKRFGGAVEFEPVSSIRAVFDEVVAGRAEFALAPVENSIIGGVGETLDCLVSHDVGVCGEATIAVHLHLFARCPLDAVRVVYSKPEVFGQCQKFLAETGLLVKIKPAASSSAAAEQAASEEGAAAIAGELAGSLFQLPRIAEFIEDDRTSVTRFLILGGAAPAPTGKDKTSIVFGVGHAPGRLAEVLTRFSDAGINLTRIESRPNRNERWSYHFFVDHEGHGQADEVRAAHEVIAPLCSSWKVLGSYPASDEVL